MNLGLSTAWNAFRHENGRDLIFEIKKLGFQEVELSFNLTAAMVRDIEGLVYQGEIKVSSVHNYCPIPVGWSRHEALPDCLAMSSQDEEERQQAVKFAKISIESAARLKARAVVLHCGRVEIPDRTRDLVKIMEKSGRGSPEFISTRDLAAQERSSQAKPYFENTLRSLDELQKYAHPRGIMLGVETRFYYREIPSLDEMGIILDKFPGSCINYWHDTGHAQLMENLDFCQHRDFLMVSAGRLLGIHLHDIQGGDDHRSPGKGKLDFALLKPYLDNKVIRVLETHHPATSQDIQDGSRFLSKALDD